MLLMTVRYTPLPSSLMSTSSVPCPDRYSCTSAMLLIRLMESRSTTFVSSEAARRCSSRSRLAMVCRLFLTR